MRTSCTRACITHSLFFCGGGRLTGRLHFWVSGIVGAVLQTYSYVCRMEGRLIGRRRSSAYPLFIAGCV